MRMHLKKHILFISGLRALKTVKDKYYLLLIAAAIDIIFLISLSWTFININISLVEHLKAVFGMIGPSEMRSMVMGGADQSALVRIMSQKPEFLAHYDVIKKLVWMFIASSYLLWSLFQGIVWWISHKAAGFKENFFRFEGKFFTINILWCGLFYLLAYGYVSISLHSSFSIRPLASQEFVNLIALALYIALFYFAFISYSLIPNKSILQMLSTTFTKGYKNFVDIAMMYIASIVPYAAIGSAIYFSYMLSPALGLAAIIVILLPYCFLKRVYYVLVVGGLK